MNERQSQLVLVDRDTDEVLAERLAILIEQSNASQGEERSELHLEILRLRSILCPRTTETARRE